MAHGFRWIPKVRTAQHRERHYSCCGALADLGNDGPHICRERAPVQTGIGISVTIPFGARPPETGRKG